MKTSPKLRRIVLATLIILMLAPSLHHAIDISQPADPPCNLHSQWQRSDCYEHSWWWHLP